MINIFPKFVSTISSLICASFLLKGCDSKTDSSDKNTLIVGVCADYPPYEYYSDGKIVGFDVELVTEIGNRMGKTIEIKDMSFGSLLGSLQSGTIDMAISSITPTPEREKMVDFSNPYYVSSVALICRSGENINSLKDLEGLSVGVQQGSTYENLARGQLTSSTVHSFERVPDAIQALKSNRIAGIYLGNNEAYAIKKTYPELDLVTISETNNPMAISFPKGSKLRDKVNDVLTTLDKEDFLSTLTGKWLEVPVSEIIN